MVTWSSRSRPGDAAGAPSHRPPQQPVWGQRPEAFPLKPGAASPGGKPAAPRPSPPPLPGLPLPSGEGGHASPPSSPTRPVPHSLHRVSRFIISSDLPPNLRKWGCTRTSCHVCQMRTRGRRRQALRPAEPWPPASWPGRGLPRTFPALGGRRLRASARNLQLGAPAGGDEGRRG